MDQSKLKSSIKQKIEAAEQGSYLLPGFLAKELDCNMLDVYKCLEDFVDDGILTSVLEVRCKRCKDVTWHAGGIFDTESSCPVCGYKPTVAELADSIVVYRKL